MTHNIAIIDTTGMIRSVIAQSYNLATCAAEVRAWKRQFALAAGCHIRNVTTAEVEAGEVDPRDTSPPNPLL